MPDVSTAVETFTASWGAVLLYLCTTVDGFFPVVPSESVLLALAALPPDAGGPALAVVFACGALGAFSGDQVAYALGRRFPLRRLRAMRSEHAQRTLAWAEVALAEHGWSCLIAARFVPGGRVVVNMTAGAVAFPPGRFRAVTAVASLLWSAYGVALGAGAGHLLGQHHSVVRMGAGVAGGLVMGLLVERGVAAVRTGTRLLSDQSIVDRFLSLLNGRTVMRTTTIRALRVILALALIGSVVVQAVMVPLLWADLEEAPTSVRVPFVVIVVLGILTLQVTAVCVWRLLTLVRRGSVFSSAAFGYVDVIFWAVAAGSVLMFALAVTLAPGEAVAPGIVGLICGASLVIAGVALLVLVLRMLLVQAVARDAQATELEAELKEVI